jgi:hypothetical protein
MLVRLYLLQVQLAAESPYLMVLTADASRDRAIQMAKDVEPECQVRRLMVEVEGLAGAQPVGDEAEGSSIAGHAVVVCSIDMAGKFEVELGAGTIFGLGLCMAGSVETLGRRGKGKERVHDSRRAPVAQVGEVMVYYMRKENGTDKFQVAVTEEVPQDVR